MIDLVMDFQLIYLQVSTMPLRKIFRICVLLLKVSFSLFIFLLTLFYNKALGWDKEKIIIIGHSYGASLGTMVSIVYSQHQRI